MFIYFFTGMSLKGSLDDLFQFFSLKIIIQQLAFVDRDQAKETPAGAVCDVICDLVSIDVATEQL